MWQGKRDVFTAPSFLDVQQRAKSFSSATAYVSHGVTLTGVGEPARIIDTEVTAGFFDVLQAPPFLGRTLVRADNQPGHADVIVLGYPLCARASGRTWPSSARRSRSTAHRGTLSV